MSTRRPTYPPPWKLEDVRVVGSGVLKGVLVVSIAVALRTCRLLRASAEAPRTWPLALVQRVLTEEEAPDPPTRS